MNALQNLVCKIELYIPQSQQKNTAVSQAAVGWHLAHALLTIQVVCNALSSSNPDEYRYTFNWKRTLVLTLNKIPRGKIKAPKVVQPKDDFDAPTLTRQLELTKENLERLYQLSPGHFFPHPFLGMIKLKPAQKFLALHTRHHLQIVEAILKS